METCRRPTFQRFPKSSPIGPRALVINSDRRSARNVRSLGPQADGLGPAHHRPVWRGLSIESSNDARPVGADFGLCVGRDFVRRDPAIPSLVKGAPDSPATAARLNVAQRRSRLMSAPSS
jgi:hypothetical protein